MKIEKSYSALSEELAAQVAKVLADGKNAYEKISHLVCESEMDAGDFFEHELVEGNRQTGN